MTTFVELLFQNFLEERLVILVVLVDFDIVKQLGPKLHGIGLLEVGRLNEVLHKGVHGVTNAHLVLHFRGAALGLLFAFGGRLIRSLLLGQFLFVDQQG